MTAALLPRCGDGLIPPLDSCDGFVCFGDPNRCLPEAEVALVVDSMYSIPLLVGALAEFQREFPPVQLRVYVETLGGTAKALIDGGADLGICLDFARTIPELHSIPMGEIELVPVRWFALVVDLMTHFGGRDALDYLAPAGSLRFRAARFTVDLSATAPLAGADRRLAIGVLRLGLVF